MNLQNIIDHHHGDVLGFSRHYLTLYSIVLGLEAKEIFEFGCGFSTQTILEALKQTGGHLTTCDLRPIEKTGNPESLMEENKERWSYIQGDSRQMVPKTKSRPLDMVLHDGAHEWWTLYRDIRNILPRVKKNGIILVHDTEHPAFHIKFVLRIALLFRRHELMTLPYGYGLTLIRLLGGKKNGSITTTWDIERTKKKRPL